MHQWWKCFVFGFSFCLKAWELLLVFFFSFFIYDKRKKKKREPKIKAVATLDDEQKACLAVEKLHKQESKEG